MIMTEVEFTSDIKQFVRNQGSPLVGISSAERLDAAPVGHRPQDYLPGARSVIVMAMPILRAYARYPDFMKGSPLVDEKVERRRGRGRLSFWEETFQARLAIANHVYRRCAYEALNMELQCQTLRLAVHLDGLGHDVIAMPVAYSESFTWTMGDPRPNWMGPFSSRHAAVAAGLARFGLNNLVLTPQYGPLQRFAVVITTAELEPDPLLEKEVCLGDECRICWKQCPNDCFDGINEYEFSGAKVRTSVMNKDTCDVQSEQASPDFVPCTRQCIFKCPVGLKRPQPAED